MKHDDFINRINFPILYFVRKTNNSRSIFTCMIKKKGLLVATGESYLSFRNNQAN